MIYLDTSVLVAYYCPEPLSPGAERVVRASVLPSVSDLTEVEFLSALSRKVRARELRLPDATRIAAEFHAHLDEHLYRRVAIDRRHFDLARGWLARFTVPLRTLDALHVAVAAMETLSLATADRGLARIASSLGVRTVPIVAPRRG